MNRIIVLLFSIIILFTACNQQEFFGKRLDGKWVYERACFHENAFKRKDILDDYRFLDVTFTANGDVEILDTEDSTFYKGTYEIDQDFNQWNDPNNTNNSNIDVVLSYQDTATKKLYVEIWDQANITKKKIRFQQRIDNKRTNFVLKKVDD